MIYGDFLTVISRNEAIWKTINISIMIKRFQFPAFATF